MRLLVFVSCLVFVLFLALLPTNPVSMFSDADTFWHLATGDLIRSSGHLPQHDSWAFTSDNTPWQNISWGWDVILSYVYQHFGWHGIIVMNSVTIALTLSLIFAACYARCGHGLAAFLVTLLVIMAMLSIYIRPYQISFLFTAMLVFLLSQIARNQCRKHWLILIPIIMIAWVNMHGGFLIAFFLLGIYGIEALLQKNWRFAGWLTVTGIASLLACLINPYGMGIGAATLRYMTSDHSFISEYKPLTFSLSFFLMDFYILLFFILAVMRPVEVQKSEKWVAYTWLLLGISTYRHLSIFAIVSAPMLAVGLRNFLCRGIKEPPPLPPLLQKICAFVLRIVNARSGVGAMLAITVSFALWMFTPEASRLYRTNSFKPPIDLAEEIAFLEAHYPHAHLINHYNFGGYLIFYGHGKIPLFVDGRGATAYPDQLMKDYVCFQDACDGWESILDRYQVDGIMIPSEKTFSFLQDRFDQRKGWKTVFKGPLATIYMRTSTKP